MTSGTGPNATVISRHFEVGAEANSTTHLAEGWFIRNENSSLGQNGKADKVWMAMGPSKASDSDAYVIALLKSGNLAPDQPVPAYCSN